MKTFLFLFVSFFLCSTAFAASDGEIAKTMLDAIMSGDLKWAAVAGLVLAVSLVRKYGSKLWSPLGSGKVAAGLAVFGSFVGAFLNAKLAGDPIDLDLLKSAFEVALFSAGGVTLMKNLAPSWLLPFIDMLFGSDKLVEAEKAGKDAVNENPSKGIDVEFKDVE